MSVQRAAFERGRARAPSGRRRAAPARRAGRRRSCRARSATRSAIATGPVSSPSSIFITITPVSASPAMMARLIGAAPRQRGSSEACRLKQPSGHASRIGLRQDHAVGDDHGGIGVVRAEFASAPPACCSVVGVSTGRPKPPRLALDRASACSSMPRAGGFRRAGVDGGDLVAVRRRSRAASAPRNPACP